MMGGPEDLVRGVISLVLDFFENRAVGGAVEVTCVSAIVVVSDDTQKLRVSEGEGVSGGK